MTTLLRIDASSRAAGSYSRQIGDAVEDAWRAANPNGTVTTRRITGDVIPTISPETITGFYTPPDQMTAQLTAATALSDRLIAELQSADTLLLTTPMYNFTVPAALKAWIDQIVRIGHTFAYEDGQFRGLVKTRRAVVVCAYGAEGYLDGQPFSVANFLEPYLKFLLSFLGIDDVEFISVQATTADPETVARNTADAIARAAAFTG